MAKTGNTKNKKQETTKAAKSEEPKQNIITKKAGLVFNVHAVRSHTSNYYETQNMKTSYTHTDEKSGKEVTSDKLPQFSGAQVAITAAFQCLTTELVKIAFNRTVKDKTGLRTITRGMLVDAVRLDYSLNRYYSWKLQSFNKDQTYEGLVPVPEKEMTLVINSIDKHIQLTPKARNVLCFLLSEAYAELVMTTFQFMAFAGKKSLKGDTVVAAIDNRFPSTLAQTLITEVNRAMTAVGDALTATKDNEDGEGDGGDDDDDRGDSDDGGDDDDDDDDDEEAVAPTKSKKAQSKTAGKKGKKTSSKIDEESDEEVDNDVQDGSGSDNEEEPVETSKKGAKAGKKGARVTRRS